MAKEDTSGGRVMTTMRLPKSLMAKLGRAARAEGRSRSNLVEHILTKAMEKKGALNVLD